MIVTEQEASVKWCPFARVQSFPSQYSGAYNRAANGTTTADGKATCVGSNCMAWVEAGFNKGFCGMAEK